MRNWPSYGHLMAFMFNYEMSLGVYIPRAEILRRLGWTKPGAAVMEGLSPLDVPTSPSKMSPVATNVAGKCEKCHQRPKQAGRKVCSACRMKAYRKERR